MATYDVRCIDHGMHEITCPINSDELKVCPECGGKVDIIIPNGKGKAPGVIYRTGGFVGSVGIDSAGSMEVPISSLSPKALAIAQGKAEFDPNANTGF